MGKRGPSSKFGSGSKVCRMPVAIAENPDSFLSDLDYLLSVLDSYRDGLHSTSPRDAKLRKLFGQIGSVVDVLKGVSDV